MNTGINQGRHNMLLQETIIQKNCGKYNIGPCLAQVRCGAPVNDENKIKLL